MAFKKTQADGTIKLMCDCQDCMRTREERLAKKGLPFTPRFLATVSFDGKPYKHPEDITFSLICPECKGHHSITVGIPDVIEPDQETESEEKSDAPKATVLVQSIKRV